MPLLPASIGIILNRDKTEVLLVKRSDIPVWVLPGGGIDPGESPETALQREMQEETGYQVRIIRKCAEYSPANALSSLTHVFICQIYAGEVSLSQETKAVVFHPLSELPSFFFPPHALWLKEALTHQGMIRRPLTEVSYGALVKYFLFHPWQVLRFAWTRFMKN